MIVFQKGANGWNKTGDQLPSESETYMQILVDADSKPLNGVYKYPEAITMVEDAIAKGAGDHYRYEITSASAKALSRAGIKGQHAPQPKAKKSRKAAPKQKAAPKTKHTQSMGWKEKRAAVIASPAFQKAYAKALANIDRKACAHGHKITPESTHVGDLLRMGRITCDTCNRSSQERYAKKAGR